MPSSRVPPIVCFDAEREYGDFVSSLVMRTLRGCLPHDAVAPHFIGDTDARESQFPGRSRVIPVVALQRLTHDLCLELLYGLFERAAGLRQVDAEVLSRRGSAAGSTSIGEFD